jgi:exonuclease SbcC
LLRAQEHLRTLDVAVEALPDATPLQRARDAHAAIEQLREQGAALLRELEAANTRVAEAAEVEHTASIARDDAQAALDAARDTHAAHALASHLVAGEPCPVCERVIETVPKRKRPPALAAADRKLAQADKQLTQARTLAGRANTTQTEIGTRAEQCKQQLDTLTAAIAEHPDAAGVVAALADIERVTAEHSAARRGEQATRAADAAAAAELVKAGEGAAHATTTLNELRDALLRARLEPPVAGAELGAAWSALVAWARSEREQQLAAGDEARAAAERARSERRSVLDALEARGRALGVAGEGRDLATLRDHVIEHGTNASNELQRIDDAIESARKAREQAAAARTEYEVADLLATQMRADRFEKWLLVEALEVLVAHASETLLALSDRHYSLRYSTDEEFVVVDHRNADATRSVRTLSGGETFQASLALALALSDQLASLSAGGGAKLDAIFLDEGFGTLDADTLETVATTIETLGSAGRMVGVVTHVPALAERVPVRYRVTRTDRTATVEREDA